MAGHWVYIDISSKTSRYTLFCEVADRPRFKNRTVRRYKPVSQSAFNACQNYPLQPWRTVRSYVFHTTRDEHRLWYNFEISWRTVCRSSLKTTRDNNVSGTNCQIAGGPSAPQGRTVRRTDHNLNQRKHPLWYNLS